MKIIPIRQTGLGGRVIITRDRPFITEIVIVPDAVVRDAMAKMTQGKVIAISEGVTQCKVGDEVIFGQYTGKHIKVPLLDSREVEEFDVMLEDDVIAIAKEDEDGN